MQLILGSVGDGGANAASDVALVQAMLLRISRPVKPPEKPQPYLSSYDGLCGKNTKAAIRDFQNDHVLGAANALRSADAPKATPGLVGANDATWRKLVEMTPKEFANMRIIAGGKIVYLAATAVDLQAKVDAVAGFTFAPLFTPKVIACINAMYERHGIAVGVCAEGDRRTFQAQYTILLRPGGRTQAGPGESNHNFGMAVDLGFEGLRWLMKNGKPVDGEDSWLHILSPGDVPNREALCFWRALRSVGTSGDIGLFRGPKNDWPHLQNWNNASVDMADRLAALLVRAGGMRWTGRDQQYQCDLGLGGPMFAVGSARQIWERRAAVTVEILTRARASVTSPPPGPAALRGAAVGTRTATAPRVSPADVTAMQTSLRAEFEAADDNWQSWSSS